MCVYIQRGLHIYQLKRMFLIGKFVVILDHKGLYIREYVDSLDGIVSIGCVVCCGLLTPFS